MSVASPSEPVADQPESKTAPARTEPGTFSALHVIDRPHDRGSKSLCDPHAAPTYDLLGLALTTVRRSATLSVSKSEQLPQDACGLLGIDRPLGLDHRDPLRLRLHLVVRALEQIEHPPSVR